ncbi:MAG: iron transporter [Fimbriimonadaceae bacterium]|nr:iron transporter [Alphaproteobacteria bacterium]
MKKICAIYPALLAAATLLSVPVLADEKEIGEPVSINGLEVAAVYLQPVKMAPMEPMAGGADIHLEADIQAAENNPNGFSAGDWVPYLEIAYHIQKIGTDWMTHGNFMPMVANDGPHYGANVALDGPGEYKVDYEIVPPVRNGLYRHTDTETGVDKWWAPFHVSWTFTYVGVGKKGSY